MKLRTSRDSVAYGHWLKERCPPFCHFADLIYASTDSSTFQLSIAGRFKFLRPVVERQKRGNERDLGIWFRNRCASSPADISSAFYRIHSGLISKWCPRPPLSNELNLEQIRQTGEDLEALKVPDSDEKSRFHLHTSLRVGSFWELTKAKLTSRR